MVVDAYSPCPCGSGKKFKWCCQAFYAQIEKAFEQHANGQHEAALKAMDQLADQYAASAEVWGRRAELLWENDRPEAAEQSIDKALEVNPGYAFGHYLRGMIRHGEGEAAGALLLYRQAAELCDPGAHGLLAEIHGSIGQCELLLNRPLAARAAWQISLRHQPEERLQQHVAEVFGAKSPFPPIVRQDHRFLPCRASGGEDPAAWNQALAGAQSGKLSDAAKAFEQLTARDPRDAAAWFNLGLVRAWLGDNPDAIEALDQYVAGEVDDEGAATAWALAEVLRLGHGLSRLCDYVEHRAVYRIVDAQAVGRLLSQDRRVVEVQQAQGVIAGSWLDRELPPADENLAGFQLPRLAAHFAIARSRLLLTNLDEEQLRKGRQALEELCGPALAELQIEAGPPRFDRLLENALSIRIPAGLTEEHARRLIDEHMRQYFEEKWLRRPLRSLDGLAPVDAVGRPVLRKKLLGVMRFMEEAAGSLPFPYDFDQLRGKLGLGDVLGDVLGDGLPTNKPQAPSERSVDIAALDAAELAALAPEQLSDEDVNKGFQTALKLGAQGLAARFAREAVTRSPTSPTSPSGDRYPLYNHLIQLALETDDTGKAQAWLQEGLHYDCEHNQGRRRNDYELRRARIHLRANQTEIAYDVFARLVQRTPTDLELLGQAAEAMLSARMAHHARTFAEQGLARSREKGDRDRAGYFEELLAASGRPTRD